MKDLLIEELEKFRKLSNYDTKLTLSENETKILDEYGGLVGSTTGKAVARAWSKSVDDIIRKLKITGKNAYQIEQLLILNSDDFTKKFNDAIRNDLKNGVTAGTLGPLAKEMSKIDVMRQIASRSKSLPKGQKLTSNEIDDIINLTAAANTKKVANFKVRTRTPKPNAEEIKIIDNTVKKYPTIKNWPWAKLLKYGGVAGLSMGVLYGIYKLTHDDEPPITQSSTNTGGGGNTGGARNRYTDCTGKGTYKKGCKTSPTGAIGQVQACLGLTQDGKFWVKTQAALETKGFSNGFTDADITKICGNQTLTPPTPAPNPDETIDTSQDLVSVQGV